jgi:hypothetical protein
MIFENSKTYDLLVFISQVVLPAVATLWAALGKIWNWPLVTEITATICAVDAFMGAVLKISSNAYKKLNQQNEE